MLSNFSNREFVFFLWIGVFAFICLTQKKIRKSVIILLNSFFHRKIILPILWAAFLISAADILLFKYGYWYSAVIKDSVFWFFSVALVMLLNSNKIESIGYFKKTALDAVKWTILIEFVVNFYTFGFFTELGLSAFLFFIALMEFATKNESRYKQTNIFFSRISKMAVLVIIGYVLYKTIITYKELFTKDNFYALIWPPALTILFLPFIYAFALYMNYGNIYSKIDFFNKNKEERREKKRRVFQRAKFNLNVLLNTKSDVWFKLPVEKKAE